ncbi:MAG TPA: L,D-transpeptidase family protein [Candidatus Saccharimonas sp.]|nr:L,D-transpeptidase family protein [Candidatus Saccharimonas sp.]
MDAHKKSAPAESPKREGKKTVSHHNRWWLFLGTAIIAVAVGVVAWFNGRALPNVVVGTIAVGGQTAQQIQQAITQQSTMQVTLTSQGSTPTTVSLKDLGVTIDANATVANVLRARRDSNILQDFQLFQTVKVPLAFKTDPGIAKVFVQQHYPSLFVDAKDAQITYNSASHQFDITPGTDGRGFDAKSFEASLPSLAANPRNTTFTLTTAAVAPILQPQGLVPAQKDANQRLGQNYTFTLNGKAIYQASRDDIANWVSFTPDAVKGTASVDFDKAKIQQLITDKISPMVAAPPVDRKVVVDKQTGSQNVISAGKPGSQIKDADVLAANVVTAVTANKSLDQQVSIDQAPFKTVTMSGYGKWIEVDVTKETATMYVGDTPVQSFLISSGKAKTPTEIGEFHVYAKVTSQTMTGTIAGEYFYLPNVKWVSFFDGDEAFHGTYWHHNFGHPMSHGCINMTEADAKILYDFAPIGTKVIVHA